MVMDFLQEHARSGVIRAYTARARIREDPELLADLRWYVAPPGAKVFPGVHAFGSNVWEQGDWDAPREGLGFLDFNFSRVNKGIAPPGVTGQGTNTPLDWFLSGVPAGVVGPYPFGPCETAGDLWTVKVYVGPGSPMPDAILPREGVQVLQYSVVDCVNRWQVILWDNDVDPLFIDSVFQLHEASFSGYDRQSPLFSTTAFQPDGSSIAESAPVVFVRQSGTTPVPVYGWALLDKKSGALIALGRFPFAPLVLRVPGDRVFIPGFRLWLSPSPLKISATAGTGRGTGLGGALSSATRTGRGTGLGVALG